LSVILLKFDDDDDDDDDDLLPQFTSECSSEELLKLAHTLQRNYKKTVAHFYCS